MPEWNLKGSGGNFKTWILTSKTGCVIYPKLLRALTLHCAAKDVSLSFSAGRV